MKRPVRFPYSAVNNEPTSLMPRLSLKLGYGNRSIEVSGLLDTGSTVNVLPYSLGVALGAIWEEQTRTVPLVGSLGRFQARALVVNAAHPSLTDQRPVRLVFAWTRAEDAPVIFGQMNFFMEFDVCFYRTQAIFEIHTREDS